VRVVDVRGEPTDADLDAFRRDGVLVLRGVVGADELARLRAETGQIVDGALSRVGQDTVVEAADADDIWFRRGPDGSVVPFRQEYVAARSEAVRHLLGHPLLARTVLRLQGHDATPTWDSMVFKAEGAGAVVPWHRDDERQPDERAAPIFNVDIYLDESDETNALWAVPGSHQWPRERADDDVRRRNSGTDFVSDGAVLVPMQPGDVLLHDIGVLHGSPASRSPLRRVVYFEFRSAADIIDRSHTAEYCTLKQAMWSRLLSRRAADTGVAAPEYTPTSPVPLTNEVVDVPQGYRFAHEEHRPAAPSVA
jgi:ectoine hydroxylase-related dioxygenase (phytanoyl-CoA dioxygenase family)